MWRSTVLFTTLAARIKKTSVTANPGVCSEITKKSSYVVSTYTKNLNILKKAFIRSMSDMDDIVALRKPDEKIWTSGTHVVCMQNTIEENELEKIKKMAKKVGLGVEEVVNWWEPRTLEEERPIEGWQVPMWGNEEEGSGPSGSASGAADR